MLTFQELGGSPTEEYTLGTFSAKRRFLVPWEQRSEFALAVFGGTKSKDRLTYPGRKDVYASTLHFEPFDPDAICVREMADLKKDAVHYNGSFARATVNYHTIDSQERGDGPLNEEGTSITYRMVVEPEEVELSPTAWRWNDTNQSVSGNVVLRKSVPATIHYVTWSNVVDPPWEAIQARQGTVNNASFLGCPAETLLFQGAEANKLYRRGSELDEGPSSFVWAIKYAFREKAVKVGVVVHGWNHVYRPETGQWIPVVNGPAKLYDSSDFNTLFHAALPDDVP